MHGKAVCQSNLLHARLQLGPLVVPIPSLPVCTAPAQVCTAPGTHLQPLAVECTPHVLRMGVCVHFVYLRGGVSVGLDKVFCFGCSGRARPSVKGGRPAQGGHRVHDRRRQLPRVRVPHHLGRPRHATQIRHLRRLGPAHGGAVC